MKRGLSNLVVVALLIVFVITLSMGFFNFVKKNVDESTDKGSVISEKLSSCRDFNVEFEKAYCLLNDEGNLDVTDNRIFIKITNNHNYDLKESFSPRLIGPDYVDASITSVNDVELNAYESKDVIIFKIEDENAISAGIYKNVDKVELIPKFFIGDEAVFCQDNKVVLDTENC
jgi:flagellin-like protein